MPDRRDIQRLPLALRHAIMVSAMTFAQAVEAQRPEIEREIGSALGPDAVLEWQGLDDRRACRLRIRRPSGGGSPEDEWPEIQTRLVETMNALHVALAPRLQGLSLQGGPIRPPLFVHHFRKAGTTIGDERDKDQHGEF